MFCDLFVSILRASCKHTANTTNSCDKEVVAQVKILDKEVENSQIFSDRLALIKFSMQHLRNPTHSSWSSGANHQASKQLAACLAFQSKSWPTLCLPSVTLPCFTSQRPLRLFHRAVTYAGKRCTCKWNQYVLGRGLEGELYCS